MTNWIEALKNNDSKKIKLLISSGKNVNDKNESGESVLAYAIRSHCDYELLRLLIESGADIYDTDDEGVSIFDMAITYNNITMVNYLITKGVDANTTQRRSGFTPLMCASCYGRGEIVKILLESGADKNRVDMKGFSATDFARKMNKKSVLKLLGYDENAPQNKNYAR